MLTPAASDLDIAVLRLSANAITPARAELWPTKRLPISARTFGYPKEELVRVVYGVTPKSAALSKGEEFNSIGRMWGPWRVTVVGQL